MLGSSTTGDSTTALQSNVCINAYELAEELMGGLRVALFY
jgi:hypothetical protein